MTPHGEGWAVSRSGSERASRVVQTKGEAMDIARAYAREENAELVVKGRDGAIQNKDSHGHDPDPPADEQ